MSIRSWVFRPALWPTLGFIICFILLLNLGHWQLQRADEKQALILAKQRHQQAAPLVFNQTQPDRLMDRFRPAVAIGHYIPGQQWLLDNRLFQGRPGYHVFSLFQLEGAGRILVNRGWISVGASRQIIPDLPLPAGMLRLSGRLDTPASVGVMMGTLTWDDAAGIRVVPYLDIAAIAAAQGLQLPPLTLVTDADQAGVLQHDWTAIETLSPEKHWGYAAQWFALACALFIIYFGVNVHRKDNHVT